MDITIGQGQGITQAIASNLGLSKEDCKNIKLESWQSVMKEVDNANTALLKNNQTSIFTGNNDINSLGDKSSYKTNFKVNENDVIKLDDSIMAKIKTLLGIQTAKEKGEEINKTFKEMGNGNKEISLQITDDNWRKLASKQNKTEEEKQTLDTQYKNGVKLLGQAYTEYIDGEYGDNNGTIDKQEYEAFEKADVPEESMKKAKEYIENSFKKLDLNKDGKLDSEEISAYMHAMDFGTEDGKSNGLNGEISAFDYNANSIALSKSESPKLDEKLAYAYKALFNKDVAK